MSFVVICLVAFAASGLTFFSGFGLGTLLLPAFALFFPIGPAVAMTAVVHFLNGLFKLALVGRHADRATLIRFGIPALVASLAGAWVLLLLGDLPPIGSYTLFDREFRLQPLKLVIGLLLLAFGLIEVVPRLRGVQFDARYLPLGGLLSGFFGGLAGMQGALRSAFLARSGLNKEAFIGTGAAIACLIDVMRLGVYIPALHTAELDWPLLLAAVAAAFAGAYLGNRLLPKITLRFVQRVVAGLLVAVAIGLISGLL